MRLRYSVSFESDTLPVRTGRGEIEVPNPRLGVRRALEAAQKQCPFAHWRSLVVVLEKLDGDPEAAEARRDEVPDERSDSPSSSDAVDPSAPDPGTPPPRESRSS